MWNFLGFIHEDFDRLTDYFKLCALTLCSKRLFRIFRLFILNILFTLWWRCRNWTLQDAWSCMGDVQKELDSKLF